MRRLLRFLVNGVLFAELAVFLKLDSVGVVLLVLHIVVIALFALGACERNLIPRGICHSEPPDANSKIHPLSRGAIIL